MAQFHLCLKGVLELHDTAPARSAALYRQAIPLSPGNLLPHLARLSRLSETHPERPKIISCLPLELQVNFLQTMVSKALQLAAENAKEVSQLKANVLTPIDISCLIKGGGYFAYASERIKDDEIIVRNLIEEGKCHLRYASARLKDNETIVMAAVQKDYSALQFASERS